MTDALPDGVWPLDADDVVGCFYCQRDRNYSSYRQGEAFLSENDLDDDGVPSYVCRAHLGLPAAPEVHGDTK